MKIKLMGLLFLFLLVPKAAFAQGANTCAQLFEPSAKIFIVSAPSGAGKTTLIEKLIKGHPEAYFVSVSTTTRGPRPGEVDGVAYNFVTVEEFQRQKAAGDFIESAEVHGNFYGTSRRPIEKALREGKTVFLNINIDGADNVRKAFPSQTRSIFVAPPSMKILEERLRARGTETEEAIQKRLKNAIEEMSHQSDFDTVIVNDKLEDAFAELKKTIALPVSGK
jgi:guanylate kinase